jgi:hypothetical protein
MPRYTWSLLFFILGVAVLLELSSCRNEQPASTKDLVVVSLTCLDGTDTVSTPKAIKDTSRFDTTIKKIPLLPGITIRRFTETSFIIPDTFIKGINKLILNKKLLLDTVKHDSAWIMLAMEPVNAKRNVWKVVHYFACRQDSAAANNPFVYFRIPDLQNPGNPVERVATQMAKNNIDSLDKYRKRWLKNQALAFPRGFKLPWCDMYNVLNRLNQNPRSRFRGVFAMKSPSEVTLYIHVAKRTRNALAPANNDDDTFYDFVNPCPNSCIP